MYRQYASGIIRSFYQCGLAAPSFEGTLIMLLLLFYLMGETLVLNIFTVLQNANVQMHDIK